MVQLRFAKAVIAISGSIMHEQEFKDIFDQLRIGWGFVLNTAEVEAPYGIDGELDYVLLRIQIPT